MNPTWQDVLTWIGGILSVVVVPLIWSVYHQFKTNNENHWKSLHEALGRIEDALKDKVSKEEFRLTTNKLEGDMDALCKKNDRVHDDIWKRVNRHGHVIFKKGEEILIGKVTVEE